MTREVPLPAQDEADRAILHRIQEWIERAVIGLNLCPFARAPVRGSRVRLVVSHARDADSLLDDLCAELQSLAAADDDECETTLLIVADLFADFLDFNEELFHANMRVNVLGGVLACKHALPHMLGRGEGSIIFTSSTSSIAGEVAQFSPEMIVAIVGPALVQMLAFDHQKALVSQHKLLRRSRDSRHFARDAPARRSRVPAPETGWLFQAPRACGSPLPDGRHRHE